VQRLRTLQEDWQIAHEELMYAYVSKLNSELCAGPELQDGAGAASVWSATALDRMEFLYQGE